MTLELWLGSKFQVPLGMTPKLEGRVKEENRRKEGRRRGEEEVEEE